MAAASDSIVAPYEVEEDIAAPPSGRKATVANVKVFRLNPPEKTGNPAVDQLALTCFRCRESIIMDILQYEELTQPIFNMVRSEKEKIIERRSIGVTDSSSVFPASTSISGLEDDFKICFVTKNSDLCGADVVSMMQYAHEQLNDLVAYALALPMKSRLPTPFLVKEVLNQFWEERYKKLGDRLKGFKAAGGLGSFWPLALRLADRRLQIGVRQGRRLDSHRASQRGAGERQRQNGLEHGAHVARQPLRLRRMFGYAADA